MAAEGRPASSHRAGVALSWVHAHTFEIDEPPHRRKRILALPCTVPTTLLPNSTVIVKLKLIGMESARNPDLLELVTRANADAEQMAARYTKAGPFNCAEHPEATPSIEVTAGFRSAVKVRLVKFCCAGLTDQVTSRMALDIK